MRTHDYVHAGLKVDCMSGPPWQVRSVKGKGLAAFATRSFMEDEEIYCDKPLLWVPFHWPFTEKQAQEVERRVEQLPAAERDVFFASANVHPEVPPASGVFYTNSFDMTGAEHGLSCAIYPNIARLNHSCRPNTRQEFCVDTLCERLFAECDIAAGEELLDSYTNLEQPLKVRREDLQKHFRFTCDCARCVEEENKLDTMDAQRVARKALKVKKGCHKASRGRHANSRSSKGHSAAVKQEHAGLKVSSQHTIIPVRE